MNKSFIVLVTSITLISCGTQGPQTGNIPQQGPTLELPRTITVLDGITLNSPNDNTFETMEASFRISWTFMDADVVTAAAWHTEYPDIQVPLWEDYRTPILDDIKRTDTSSGYVDARMFTCIFPDFPGEWRFQIQGYKNNRIVGVIVSEPITIALDQQYCGS